MTQQADSVVIKKKRGFVRFVFALIKAMLWGLAIGLLINGILWHIEGYHRLTAHLQHTYQTQMQSIALRNETAVVGLGALLAALYDSAEAAESKLQQLYKQHPTLIRLMQRPTAKSVFSGIATMISHLIVVTLATLKILIAKFFSIFVSLWVLIFASITGAMDGLLARYIRTSEGGRESTFVFHRISDSVIKFPVAIIFLYLSLPVFWNPEWIVVLLSILFFLFFYLATANLKKFL